MLRIESRDAPAADLQRIAIVLLNDALRRRSVHEIRKRLKETRAVIRLLANGPRAKRAQRLLRDVAHVLAPARDAESVVEAFNHLRLGRKIGAEERDRIRNALSNGRAEIDLRPLRARLVAVRDEIARWPVDDASRLERIPVRTYRAARKRMDRAVRSGEADDLHSWRRRVKEQWYQSMLLAELVPEFGGRARRLHELSRALGDHHDLAILEAAIEARQDIDDATRTAIMKMARARKTRLEARAIVLGSDLFGAPPSELTVAASEVSP